MRLYLGEDPNHNMILVAGADALELVNDVVLDTFTEVCSWPDPDGHLALRAINMLAALGCVTHKKCGALSLNYIRAACIPPADVLTLVQIAYRRGVPDRENAIPPDALAPSATPDVGSNTPGAGLDAPAPSATPDEELEALLAGLTPVAGRDAPGTRLRPAGKKVRPPLSAFLREGSQVKHFDRVNDTWIAYYDSAEGVLRYKDRTFTSLSAFSSAHYASVNKNRTASSNGWAECRVLTNGKWVEVVNEWEYS
jgi:hypothetical protein